MESENALRFAIERMSLITDVDHYMERINELPNNVWFKPTNKDNDDYFICAHLFEMNLICKKTLPIWQDGSMRGQRIYFYINQDLDFSKAD